MNYTTQIKYLPFYALSVLPMPLLYLLSDVLFIAAYHIIGYRKAVVRENLQKAFPSTNEKKIKDIEQHFYRHFCNVAVESIKTLTISEKRARQRLKVRNPDLPVEHLKGQKRILVYAAHQGNWEWLVYLPLYLKYPSYTFYRPLQNTYFNGLFLIIRQRFGVNCVASKKGYRTIMEQDRKRIPAMNCLIGDQSPRRSEPKKWCRFLGRETAFFVGTEKIAQRTDSIVLFPKFTKIKRGFYELEFLKVEKQLDENGIPSIIEGYAHLLEDSIVESPELWLWSHRRWKISPSPVDMPLEHV